MITSSNAKDLLFQTNPEHLREKTPQPQVNTESHQEKPSQGQVNIESHRGKPPQVQANTKSPQRKSPRAQTGTKDSQGKVSHQKNIKPPQKKPSQAQAKTKHPRKEARQPHVEKQKNNPEMAGSESLEQLYWKENQSFNTLLLENHQQSDVDSFGNSENKIFDGFGRAIYNAITAAVSKIREQEAINAFQIATQILDLEKELELQKIDDIPEEDQTKLLRLYEDLYICFSDTRGDIASAGRVHLLSAFKFAPYLNKRFLYKEPPSEESFHPASMAKHFYLQYATPISIIETEFGIEFVYEKIDSIRMKVGTKREVEDRNESLNAKEATQNISNVAGSEYKKNESLNAKEAIQNISSVAGLEHSRNESFNAKEATQNIASVAGLEHSKVPQQPKNAGILEWLLSRIGMFGESVNSSPLKTDLNWLFHFFKPSPIKPDPSSLSSKSGQAKTLNKAS